MDVTGTLGRHALIAWRDSHVLAVLGLFNARAREARAAFDAQLEQAGLVDSVWDPAGFADARIDRLMLDTLAPVLPGFLAEAGQTLARLSPDFVAIADALASADSLVLPQLSVQPEAATPQPEAKPEPVTANPPPASSRWALGETLMRRASEASGRAAQALREAGTFAERNLQQRTGLDDRLRAAAGQRIATRWMGREETPSSVLAQVLARIDEAAFNARMTTL